MFGIVGYAGSREAVPILVDCLSRLEYRGYEPAVATLEGVCPDLRGTCGKYRTLRKPAGHEFRSGTNSQTLSHPFGDALYEKLPALNAVPRGCYVDRPCRFARSVTVE